MGDATCPQAISTSKGPGSYSGPLQPRGDLIRGLSLDNHHGDLTGDLSLDHHHGNLTRDLGRGSGPQTATETGTEYVFVLLS